LNLSTSDTNIDDGPIFVSDVVRKLRHLQKQQEGLERRLHNLMAEHELCSHRLNAVEKILKNIDGRESKLEDDIGSVKLTQTINETRRISQRTVITAVVLTVAPPVIAFLSWFVPETLKAIRHAIVEEENWRLRQDPYRPNLGSPVIPRSQKKP
jgi:hypothetical protein